MTAVVILAAGMGTRFGDSGHKALEPVSGSRGTLSLLIEQALDQPGLGPVTVVTGRFSEAVEEDLRGAGPSVRTVHNARYASTGPLQSLACGVEGIAEDVLALNADTVYEDEFMAAITRSAAASAAAEASVGERWVAGQARVGAVFVQPAVTPREPGAVHIPVCVDGGVVTSLGQGSSPYEMATAVLWPAESLPEVRAAGRGPASKQWPLLADLVRPGRLLHRRLPAVEVPRGSSYDVNSLADVAVARERLR